MRQNLGVLAKLLLLAFASVGIQCLVSAGPATAADPNSATSRAGTVAAPETVIVGTYVRELVQVDIALNRFVVDFDMWMKWSGPIDPTSTWVFSNQIETWSQSKTALSETPILLPNGQQYQSYHIQATFASYLDFRAFPLDTHDLPMLLRDSKYPASQLVYAVEPESAGITDSPELILGGWKMSQPPTATISMHQVNSGLGMPAVSESLESVYTYMMYVERPAAGYLLPEILPITIVMLMVILVFLMSPAKLDTRVAVASAALISAVLLHLAALAELPHAAYVTLLDKIYILSYVVILATFLESICAARIYKSRGPEYAKRIDRYSAAGVVVLLVGGVILLILLI